MCETHVQCIRLESSGIASVKWLWCTKLGQCQLLHWRFLILIIKEVTLLKMVKMDVIKASGHVSDSLSSRWV